MTETSVAAEGYNMGVISGLHLSVSNDFNYNHQKKQVFFEIISTCSLHNDDDSSHAQTEKPVTKKSFEDFRQIERLLNQLELLDNPNIKPLDDQRIEINSKSKKASFEVYILLRRVLNQWLKDVADHFQEQINKTQFDMAVA